MESSSNSLRNGKKAIKQDQIIDALRRRILDGDLKGGAKLPTRKELESEFGASLQTIQRALDRLAAEGFVRARGSRGTLVTDSPPHLCHYGLAVPGYPTAVDPDELSLPRYWTAMINEAQSLKRQGDRRCSIYYGINGHTDSEDFQRLTRDIRSHRLAGLIFPTNPFELIGTPVMDTPGLPRVAVMKNKTDPNMSCVRLDGPRLMTRAMDYLVARGRRRVAMVSTSVRVHDEFLQLAHARSMQVEPYWLHAVPFSHPQATQSLVHLLMNTNQVMRPDAIVIADDNLAEYASAGLVLAGVRVGVDVDVIAHCNFPWPTPSAVPVTRLGYDARQILQACIDAIDAQRRGEPATETVVAPLFEHEVNRPVQVNSFAR